MARTSPSHPRAGLPSPAAVGGSTVPGPGATRAAAAVAHALAPGKPGVPHHARAALCLRRSDHACTQPHVHRQGVPRTHVSARIGESSSGRAPEHSTAPRLRSVPSCPTRYVTATTQPVASRSHVRWPPNAPESKVAPESPVPRITRINPAQAPHTLCRESGGA